MRREQINKEQLLLRIDNLLKEFSDPAFPDDVEAIKSWKSEVKRAIIIDDLKEHEGIKMIVEFIDKEILDIDLVLTNAYSDKCPDKVRDRLLDKKQLYLNFLELFPDEVEIQQIEKEVKKNEDSFDK